MISPVMFCCQIYWNLYAKQIVRIVRENKERWNIQALGCKGASHCWYHKMHWLSQSFNFLHLLSQVTLQLFCQLCKGIEKLCEEKPTTTSSAVQDEDVTTVVTATVTTCMGVASFSADCLVFAFLFSECGFEKDCTPAMKETSRNGAREHPALGLCTALKWQILCPFLPMSNLPRLLHWSQVSEHVDAHVLLLLNWSMVSSA